MPNGVITEIGRKKLCKAHAGDITLPKITQMAFGSGGVNPSGEVIAPTGAETALKKEILKSRGAAEVLLAALITARATSYMFSKLLLETMGQFTLLGLRSLLAFAVLLAISFKYLKATKKKMLHTAYS